MNTNPFPRVFRWRAALLAKAFGVGGYFLLSTFAFPQGSLTPPGAPAPTFKTLTQVEPRSAINTTTSVTINASGSYYLTANINVIGGNAINITANNVTLDLNGFTVSSTAPSATGTGILLASGLADITILNGHIKGGVINNAGVYSGSGFANGISYIGSIPSNVRVAGVSVSGCLTYGIYLNMDNSTVVESCTAQTIGNYGIVASSVAHSTAYPCGNDAIFANIASDCYGSSTGSGSGVHATTANSCQGNSNSGIGLSANTANNCYGLSTSGTGLSAGIANNCYGSGGSFGLIADRAANNCYGSGGTGLSASTANNCYGLSSSGTGLSADTANNCSGSGGGTGLYAQDLGIGCFGFGGDYGVNVNLIAIGCYGVTNSGVGLRSGWIANSCLGVAGSGDPLFPSEDIIHKYNMP